MRICRLSVFFGLLLWANCESADEKMKRYSAEEAAKRDQTNPQHPDGLAIFRRHCIVCHGADGKLGLNGAKDLSASERSLPERVEIITKGKNLMTPFGAILSKEEIEAVANYSLSLKKQQ